MRRSLAPRTLFRNSLALKVIVTNVLLGLILVLLTGTTLYKQLSDGIRKVKVESATGEARSVIFNAQYRMLVATNTQSQTIKKIVEDIVVNPVGVVGQSVNSKEVVLLKSGPLVKGEQDYQLRSNLVLIKSIPLELRKRVQKSSALQWSYSTVFFQDGNKRPGLVIGERLNIRNAGQYEMYLLFNLNVQTATLALLRRALYFFGISLLLLIALLTALVIRQVVRPVREAARIAEGFTAGDLGQRMEVVGKDEIARLGHSFNEMADSLQEQISRLENLSRVQQRFVSDVSHELRTPLTTLRMASAVIYSSRDRFDHNVARSTELLVAQLDRFERLLEDLLEVSRFDAEVAVLEIVQFDLVGLVGRAISDLNLLAAESGTSIQLVAPDVPEVISADVRRVERILRNLLTNAIEYSEGKAIQVTVASSESAVAVGVRDHGIGIGEQNTFRVFDRFWRADLSRARVRGGTGLGLSISLEDARLHNGELEVWGRLGEGAHFVLTLPRVAGNEIEARVIRLQPEDYLST
jgi:two-component system sensor histidine kinase MtrB